MFPPPKVPTLARGNVHIWRVRLDEIRQWYTVFWGILAPEERMRAMRYRVSGARERFVLARGSLRVLLAGYCGIAGESVGLATGPHGKPYVTLSDCLDLSFNLAHSGVLVMYAFTRGWEVGIDVERPDQVAWTPFMLRTIFSEEERAYLATLGPAEWQLMACSMWTVKEAKAKATGLGLARSLSSDASTPGASSWRLHTFEAAPGYIATVALHRNRPIPDYGGALIYLHFPR